MRDISTVAEDAQSGVDLNQLIETNIHDDVTQTIYAGDGLDVIEIGVGDNVNTLTTTPDGHTDIAGEGGDHIELQITDTALADLPIPLADGDGYGDGFPDLTGASFIRMGSDDTLDISFADGVSGQLHAIELETEWLQGSHAPPGYVQSLVLFHVPDGQSLDGLIDPDSYNDYGDPFYFHPSVTPEDLGDIRVIGVVQLGAWAEAGYFDDDPSSTIYYEGFDETRDAPVVTSNLTIYYTPMPT